MGSPTRPYRLFATKTILNPGEDDELECYGYRKNVLKTIFTHLISVLMLGTPYLLAYWKPTWKIAWFCSKCPLYKADTVLLKQVESNDVFVEKIQIKPVSDDFPSQFTHKYALMFHKVFCILNISCFRSNMCLENDISDSASSSSSSSSEQSSDTSPLWLPSKLTMRFFDHHHVKYIWDAKKKSYTRLNGLDKDTPISHFSSHLARGLTRDMQAVKQILFGPNSIDVEVKPYLKLLFDEVLNPFYIFQICSMILWSFDEYYYYAGCIFFISLVSVVVSLVETRRQSQSLHDMVASSNELTCTVYRGRDTFEDVASTEVVPGNNQK